MLRLAAVCGAAVARARRLGRWLARWAVRRSVSPNSLAGISLLLAICAAVWFSAARGERAWGLAAMGGWLLMLAAARRLADFLAGTGDPPSTPRGGRRAAAAEDGTDWLVLPGVRWDDLALAGRAAAADAVFAQDATLAADQGATEAGVIEAGDEDEDEAGAGGFGWIAAVCSVAAECAVYGGLAAGGLPGTPVRAWPLAVLTVASVAAGDLLGACREAAVAAGRCRDPGRNPVVTRWARRLLRPPPGARAVLAAAGFVLGGPEAALFAVLGAQAAVIGCTLCLLAWIAPAATPPAVTAAVTAGGSGGSSPRAGTAGGSGGSSPRAGTAGGSGGSSPRAGTAGGSGGSSPRASTAGAVVSRFAATRPVWAARRRDQASAAAGRGTAATRAAPRGADAVWLQDGGAGGLAVIRALRDDGAASRWAGRLVQGALIPLPPALAGLVATAMLAALGLRHLPGFIALTPPVVMMLAAPGSSHPHDGRFDWLVPVLLAAAQYIYFGSLGFGLAVPGSVVYSACAMTALWYACLAARGQFAAGQPAELAAAGWETRLFAIGFAAAFGLATFGYLGLAAYLGVLICRKIMAGYLIAWEEDRR